MFVTSKQDVAPLVNAYPVNILKRTTIDSPVKYHLMVFRWRMDGDPTLCASWANVTHHDSTGLMHTSILDWIFRF